MWRPGSRHSVPCGPPPPESREVGDNASETEEESFSLAPYLAADEQCSAGLGAIQPSGKARLLLQWCRPGSQQHLQERPGQRRGSKETRRGSCSALAARAPLRMWTTRLKNLPTPRLEWSTLSSQSRSAIKQWIWGQIGGRHCLMLLEHDEAINLLISPLEHSETALSDLKGGVLLCALSGLPPDVQGGWLYRQVFSKSPVQVFDDACQAAADDVSMYMPEGERAVDLSAEQVNIALRHRAIEVQHSGMRSMAENSPPSGEGPRWSEEFMRIQVWLELARMQAEGELEGVPELAPGRPPRPAPLRERDPRAPRRPADDGEEGGQGWDDRHVLGQLGKPESELTAEASTMSLDALRLQNVSIESYLMRLVRQREQLKHMARLAEECDSYMVLGLDGPDVSDIEVKKAYRNLARKEHPDKAGTENKERFQEIQQAYTSLLLHRQSSVAEDQGSCSKENWAGPRSQSSWQLKLSPPTDSAVKSTEKARDAAAAVTSVAHVTLRFLKHGSEARTLQKRPALRQLTRLTEQAAIRLRSCGGHLRLICESATCVSESAEKALAEYGLWAETATAGAGLKQRAMVVAQAGQSCLATAEYMEKISDSDENMLRRMERVMSEGGGALETVVAQGVRSLSEGLPRTAAVARCAADEAIATVASALELTCSLVALDRAHSQEKAQAKDAQSDPATPTPAAATEEAGGEGGPLDIVSSGASRSVDRDASGSDGEKSPPKRAASKSASDGGGSDDIRLPPEKAKSKQESLRVKNILCLESINEEVLALQKSLRARLQQQSKSLLPAVEPAHKDSIFDLVTQMLQSAITEATQLATATTLPLQQVLEQVFRFITAVEHTREVAVPADVKTQTLKLAAMLDVNLLCRIVEGPFRQRLLCLGACRRAGGAAAADARRGTSLPRSYDPRRSGNVGEGWAEAVHDLVMRAVAGLRRSCSVES